jgi:hypothetical protein
MPCRTLYCIAVDRTDVSKKLSLQSSGILTVYRIPQLFCRGIEVIIISHRGIIFIVEEHCVL